jgi:tRNA(fMet)-specific endonuclease VapC
MRYLLDTNTCIAAMRNDIWVVKRMSSLSPGECAISAITSYELNTGVAKCANPAKELAKINFLFATVGQLAFESHAAREAAAIRALLESQGNMIGPYDVLLAGHAKSLSLILVTANTAEFNRVPTLSLENWQLPPAP